MSNLLIVESKNDKIFIETLISELNYDIDVDEPICTVDEYECLEGLSQARLTTALKELAADIQKREIEKVGIVIDLDDKTVEDRLQLINQSIQEALGSEVSIPDTGEFIEVQLSSGETLQLSCYFTNIDNQGELETVLKQIKSCDSTFADCLETWRDCIESRGKSIKLKDFDKFWVSLYIRFDTCSSKEKKQAARKCSISNFEYIMRNKKEIWDFNHPKLDEIKNFLRLFN